MIKFETPVVEIEKFELCDVITTSEECQCDESDCRYEG
jgi:hypothetical protein